MDDFINFVGYDEIHALIQQSKFRDGIILLNFLIDHQPHDPRWYELQIIITNQILHVRDFKYWYELIHEKFPDTSQAWMAKALFPGVGFHQSKTSLKRALKKDPENPYIHYYLGKTYRNLRNYQQAIASLSQCLRLDKHFYLAYLLRSDCYKEIGDLKHTIQDAFSAVCYMNDVNKQYIFKKILDEFERKSNSSNRLPVKNEDRSN